MTEKPKISRVEVYWHTVKYRTVLLYAVVVTTIVLATTYLVFPEVSANVVKRLSEQWRRATMEWRRFRRGRRGS